MKSRKEKVLLNLLLGTGIYLLDSMRGRMAGTVEDLRSKAQDTYETASDRVSRAADVIPGEDNRNMLGALAAENRLGFGRRGSLFHPTASLSRGKLKPAFVVNRPDHGPRLAAVF